MTKLRRDDVRAQVKRDVERLLIGDECVTAGGMRVLRTANLGYSVIDPDWRKVQVTGARRMDMSVIWSVVEAVLNFEVALARPKPKHGGGRPRKHPVKAARVSEETR